MNSYDDYFIWIEDDIHYTTETTININVYVYPIVRLEIY